MDCLFVPIISFFDHTGFYRSILFITGRLDIKQQMIMEIVPKDMKEGCINV